MSMVWFGKRYQATAYSECSQAETPVDCACIYCREKIVHGDDGWIYVDGSVLHRECHFRGIIGSVAHQQKRCSCFGGTDFEEEDGMTRREAAKAACEYFERRAGRQ